MGRQKTPMGYIFDIVEKKMGCGVSSKKRKMLKEHLERMKPPYCSVDYNQLLNDGNYEKVADICIDRIIAWDLD